MSSGGIASTSEEARGWGRRLEGEVIPGVQSTPFLERRSLSQDSCCGHTTNLKAALLLGACLSSPRSPAKEPTGWVAVRAERRSGGTGAPPAFPPRRRQRLRAPPGPPALRGSAWAAAPKNSRLCQASWSSRPSPAVPASLLKQRRREGKSGKSCQQEGKSGFGSPAAPVGGCSGSLMLSRDGGM